MKQDFSLRFCPKPPTYTMSPPGEDSLAKVDCWVCALGASISWVLPGPGAPLRFFHITHLARSDSKQPKRLGPRRTSRRCATPCPPLPFPAPSCDPLTPSRTPINFPHSYAFLASLRRRRASSLPAAGREELTLHIPCGRGRPAGNCPPLCVKNTH